MEPSQQETKVRITTAKDLVDYLSETLDFTAREVEQKGLRNFHLFNEAASYYIGVNSMTSINPYFKYGQKQSILTLPLGKYVDDWITATGDYGTGYNFFAKNLIKFLITCVPDLGVTQWADHADQGYYCFYVPSAKSYVDFYLADY